MAEFIYEPLDEDDFDIYSDTSAAIKPTLGIKKSITIEQPNDELITAGELFESAKEIIEKIRPFVKKDGGDVTAVGISNGWLKLKFLGNCNSCGAFSGTLIAIEESICEELPDIKGVDVIQD